MFPSPSALSGGEHGVPPGLKTPRFVRFTMSIPENDGVFQCWQLFFNADYPNNRNTFNPI